MSQTTHLQELKIVQTVTRSLGRATTTSTSTQTHPHARVQSTCYAKYAKWCKLNGCGGPSGHFMLINGVPPAAALLDWLRLVGVCDTWVRFYSAFHSLLTGRVHLWTTPTKTQNPQILTHPEVSLGKLEPEKSWKETAVWMYCKFER